MPRIFHVSSIKDKVVPKQHMTALYSLCRSQKKSLLPFEGGHHTSKKVLVYWKAIEDFVYPSLTASVYRDIYTQNSWELMIVYMVCEHEHQTTCQRSRETTTTSMNLNSHLSLKTPSLMKEIKSPMIDSWQRPKRQRLSKLYRKRNRGDGPGFCPGFPKFRRLNSGISAY